MENQTNEELTAALAKISETLEVTNARLASLEHLEHLTHFQLMRWCDAYPRIDHTLQVIGWATAILYGFGLLLLLERYMLRHTYVLVPKYHDPMR